MYVCPPCVWCPQWPKESVVSPGTGTGGCEWPCRNWEFTKSSARGTSALNGYICFCFVLLFLTIQRLLCKQIFYHLAASIAFLCRCKTCLLTSSEPVSPSPSFSTLSGPSLVSHSFQSHQKVNVQFKLIDTKCFLWSVNKVFPPW